MINPEGINGQFAIFSRIEPKTKIIITTAASIIIAVSHQINSLTVALAISIFLMILARFRLRELIGRIKAIGGFLILLWIILPLTVEGDPIFQIGGLIPIYQEGIRLALTLSLKSLSIGMIMITLIASSNIAVLGHAMGKLGVPDKLVMLILLTYRYLFVLQEEFNTLKRAAEIRGFRPGTNLHTYKTIANFFAMVLIRAIERAERINWAMKCRGFNGTFYCLDTFTFQRKEAIFILGSILSLAFLSYLEWGPFWA